MLIKKKHNTYVNANKIILGDEEDFELIGDFVLDVPFSELVKTLEPGAIYLSSFFNTTFDDYGFIITDGVDVHFFNLEYEEKIKNILKSNENNVELSPQDMIIYIEL